MSTFDNLVSSLAEFGVTLEERTRLAFASLVLKALTTVPQGTGRVVILCNGTPKVVSDRFANLTDEERKSIAVVTCDADYMKVRPHVTSTLKARKIPHGTSASMKDADKNPYGFGIIRK